MIAASEKMVTIDGLDLLQKKTDGQSISAIRSLKRLDMEHNRRPPNQQHGRNSFKHNGKDMGRHAAKIIVEGEIMGERAPETIGELRKKYIRGKPVEFVSQFSLEYGINKVMIDQLNINTAKGRPYHFQYMLHLVEYVEH